MSDLQLTPEEEQEAKEWSKKFNWKEAEIREHMESIAAEISYYGYRYSLAKATADRLKHKLGATENIIKSSLRQKQIPASGGKTKNPTDKMVEEWLGCDKRYLEVCEEYLAAKHRMEVFKSDVESALAKKEAIKSAAFQLFNEEKVAKETL